MAEETEQLVVQLEARIRDFERNMEKASGTADKSFSAIERRAKSSAAKLEATFGNVGQALKERFGDIGKELLIAGGGALISEKSLEAIREVVKSVADMADQAESIGLAVEDFQAIAFAGHQSGVETDKLTSLFQKFNVQVSEARTKGNDLSAILQANGVSLFNANGELRTQKELFYEIVHLITSAKSAQDQAAIAQAAFSKGGADALPFLKQGVEAIQQSEQAARDSGAVISKELVEKAHAFDDAWTAVWDSFSARSKSAVLGIMTDLDDLISKADGFLGKLIDTGKAGAAFQMALRTNPMTASSMLLYDRYMSGTPYKPLFDEGTDQEKAEKEVAALAQRRLEIEKQIADFKAKGADDGKLEDLNDLLDMINGKLEEARRKQRALFAEGGPAFERGSGINQSAPTVVPDSEGVEHAVKKGILDLIGYSEGTDKGRGYNETLMNGKFTGGDVNLVNMNLKQIMDLQTQMLRNPENTFNSSAVGRYQITKRTLQGLMDQLGLSGDEQFTPELQDKLASALVARRGNNPAALRNEWEGLRTVSDQNINSAMGNSSSVVESGTKALNAQRDAYAKLTTAQRLENGTLALEARAMGMSTFEAEKLRKENELLNETKKAGVPITEDVKAGISRLATEYAKGKVAIADMQKAQDAAAKASRQAQEQVARANQEFNGAFSGAFKGFLSDLIHGTDAVKALQSALLNLADSLMNQVVDRMFEGKQMLGGMGGGKGKMGGLGGASMFSMMGFAEGGHVKGPGTSKSDSIPAMLSDGEFVVNAASTQKHRALLETINSGKIARFADGGIVGNGKPVPVGFAANDNSAVTINAPVTVNATGGDPKQNADLARRVAKEVENNMRGVVVKELMAQMRPGNMLNRQR